MSNTEKRITRSSFAAMKKVSVHKVNSITPIRRGRPCKAPVPSIQKTPTTRVTRSSVKRSAKSSNKATPKTVVKTSTKKTTSKSSLKTPTKAIKTLAKSSSARTSTSQRRKTRLQPDEFFASTLEEFDKNCDQTFDWDVKTTGIFMNKWILLEKVNCMSHSSPVYRVMRKDGTYGDLRCFKHTEIHKMNMEVLCLDKMERYGKSAMFRKICNLDTVKSEKEGLYSYIITFHKPGFKVEDLIKEHGGSLDIQSGTRIGLDIIEIVENLCKTKLLMTDIRPDHFSVDQISGKTFLSNASKVIYNSERGAMSYKFHPPKWDGLDIYAPLNSHIYSDAPMCEADLVESAFYVYLHIIGHLPWIYEQEDMIDTKKRWRKAIFQELQGDNIPDPLITCLLVIQRGQALDINREHNMKNGSLIFHQYRRLVYKRKPLSTSSWIDYNLVYASLRNFAGKGNIDESLLLPHCLNKTSINNTRGVLLNALMHIKTEINALNIEINELEQSKKNREVHTTQLDAEVLRNERYIQKFVFEDIKLEGKIEDDIGNIKEEESD